MHCFPKRGFKIAVNTDFVPEFDREFENLFKHASSVDDVKVFIGFGDNFVWSINQFNIHLVDWLGTCGYKAIYLWMFTIEQQATTIIKDMQLFSI